MKHISEFLPKVIEVTPTEVLVRRRSRYQARPVEVISLRFADCTARVVDYV